jgi:hypothetical protein
MVKRTISEGNVVGSAGDSGERVVGEIHISLGTPEVKTVRESCSDVTENVFDSTIMDFRRTCTSLSTFDHRLGQVGSASSHRPNQFAYCLLVLNQSREKFRFGNNSGFVDSKILKTLEWRQPINVNRQ